MAPSFSLRRNLHAVRAGLGCLLVALHARTLFIQFQSWSTLGHDWAFATSVACHVGWLLSSATDSLSTRTFCYASHIAPKISLLAELFSHQTVPASEVWFGKSCWQQQRWHWRAMAEVFVYTCGEFRPSKVISAAVVDIACTVAIWASVCAFTGAQPAGTGAAHVLLRLLLSIATSYCQKQPSLGFLRRLPVPCWSLSRNARASVKTDGNLCIMLTETPVRSSLACCNNPTMLKHIVDASAKDLQPVRLDRLSATCMSNDPLPEPGTSADGTEAYELARRLVSSAGASGRTAAGGSYTSAASKVRVSVKIPDRALEDLPPGWDSELQVNGQRQSALVLFTYMRRGCIQLVLDFISGMPQATGTRAGAGPAAAGQVPRAASCAGDRHVLAAPSGPPHPTAGGPVDRRRAAEEGKSADWTSFSSSMPAGCGPEALTADRLRVPLATAAAAKGLLAGCTMTVQVGATVSRVQVPDGTVAACEPDADGAEPALLHGSPACSSMTPPPNVCVEPRVVCTATGRWRNMWRAAGREVLVSCSWNSERHGGGGTGRGTAEDTPLGIPSVPPTGSPQSAPDPWREEYPFDGPQLQLTVRQQGYFLPVAHAASGSLKTGGDLAALRSDLDRGAIYAAVDHCDNGTTWESSKGDEVRSGGGRRCGGATAGCRLAFVPVRADGLVQIELSRGGVHSATAASVLLVSNAAVACELQQLQAAAAAGTDLPGGVAAFDHVLQDLGVFLDLVSAMTLGLSRGTGSCGTQRDGPSAASLPIFSWVAAPADAPCTAPVPAAVFVTTPSALSAAAGGRRTPGHQAGPCAGEAGATSTGEEADEDDLPQRLHLLSLASLSSQLGFSLLCYFLSCGLPACSSRVLDTLSSELGIPAALVADYVCPEGLTLLHHASRGRSFAAVSALAGWLEARGLAPGWSAPSPAGLTPLHLLAVVEDSGAVTELVKLRWRAARVGWTRSTPWPEGCDASPAEFASLVPSPSSSSPGAGQVGKRSWLQAYGAGAAELGIGTAWEAVAVLYRRAVPDGWIRTLRDIVTPCLGFSQPSLEASYGSWLARRSLLMDRIFLSLETTFCTLGLLKHGLPFFWKHNSGIVLWLVRLTRVALSSRLRRMSWKGLQQWRSKQPAAPQPPLRYQAAGIGGLAAGAQEVSGPCLSAAWLLVEREGLAVTNEFIRMLVMFAIFAGLMPVPNSWQRVLQLRLDWIFNALLRPITGQMRMLPTVLTSVMAVVGESLIVVRVMQTGPGWVGFLTTLTWALARNLTTHSLGWLLALRLQALSRSVFLDVVRGGRLGAHAHGGRKLVVGGKAEG